MTFSEYWEQLWIIKRDSDVEQYYDEILRPLALWYPFLYKSWHNRDALLKKPNPWQILLLLLYLFYPLISVKVATPLAPLKRLSPVDLPPARLIKIELDFLGAEYECI